MLGFAYAIKGKVRCEALYPTYTKQTLGGLLMPPVGPPALIHARYRLTEWLGQGNLGLVYRAQDEILDRPVVIKFYPVAPGAQGAASARFLREARSVARLSHPNLVAIYDLGEQSGWNYLVLEYIPGKDLLALIRQYRGRGATGLPLPDVLRVARGVLNGLSCAHQQGILHRDIRPENIRLAPDGQVKLTDFSLALRNGPPGENEELGALLYRAPECLSGQPADSRADLYGLGAVLYELVSGRPPFNAETAGDLSAAILSAPIQPPRKTNPELPATVEPVILKLLARDPALRYPSAQAALADLPEETPQDGDRWVVSPQAELSAAAALSTGLESERQRLARLLQARVVDPLNLLLAQTGTFEQTLAGHPQARIALSVVASLTRQVLQQARDLESVLHPAALETLGLEAALELLAEQSARGLGLTLKLEIGRLSTRLAPPLELAIFRLIQEALEALPNLYVTQAALRVVETDDLQIELGWSGGELPEPVLGGLRARGGATRAAVEQKSGPDREMRLAVKVPLRPEIEFTPRELDVLHGLVAGLSNKEIAARLGVRPRTVNFHLDNIYAKLGVNTRTEAAVMAVKQGWGRDLSSLAPRESVAR
jgi:DNA-binding CsgD family transcriptional regulator